MVPKDILGLGRDIIMVLIMMEAMRKQIKHTLPGYLGKQASPEWFPGVPLTVQLLLMA